jgi:hypothetical protein
LTSKLHQSTNHKDYIEARYLALSLIIGRSFPKISQRVQALQYLFTSKFLERLVKQELNLSGELVVTPPKQVRVRQAGGHCYIEVGTRLQVVFVFNEVPCETRDGIFYFIFHISSGMLWIRTLVSVYNSVKVSMQRHPTNEMEWYALYT